MACHLLEALVMLPLVCTTLLTRVVSVGTQDQDGSLVFPVVASIASEDNLLDDLHEQRGSIRDPESSQDLHSAFKKGASIPPPGTPTIQTVNISAVLITWTYPPNLPSPIYFYVQCSIDGDPFANISGLVPYTPGVTLSFVYRGLLFQAFYQFQVIASYAGESSDPSGTSNAFINGVTAPSGPPTNIRVMKVTSGDVEMVWKRPDFPIFASFIYTLYWGTAWNELEQSEIIMDVTSTAVSNLHPNTTYFFAMVAMLSGFPSVLSDILSATTTLPTLGQVSIVDTKSSQSWVWLQWTAPPPTPYLVQANQYTITCSGRGVKYVSGQIQSAVIAGLDPGTMYEFWVSYTSGGFLGPPSEHSRVSTLQGPNCYSCRPLLPTSLLIEWENPSVTNETLTLYEVAGNMSDTLVTIPLQGNGSYVVEGLRPYTQHQFWIGLGTSHSWCPLGNCRTIQQAPNGPPREISVATRNWSTVELEWKPPLPTQQNGPITGYVVEVIQVDAGALGTSQLSLPHRTLNVSELCTQVTGLQPFSSYSFVVTAGTVAGLGPGSDPVVVSAQDLATYLEVDIGLRATLQAGTSSSPCYLVLVAWNPGVTFPPGVVSPQRVNVAGYVLRYGSRGATGNGTVEVVGGGTEVQLGSDMLHSETTYTLSLTVEGLYDGVELNLTSVPANVTCPDCGGSQVPDWIVVFSSLVGILVLVVIIAIPMAICCWAKRPWKRRPLPHSYLMDDHTCYEDTPSMDNLCAGDTPPVEISSEGHTPNSGDQRIVIGESDEASPPTPDNTSVVSDDDLVTEPLLGCQHIISLPGVMGGVHESCTFDCLNNQDYQLHDILQGTRYAPEGCSSSSSNSSASVSDITAN